MYFFFIFPFFLLSPLSFSSSLFPVASVSLGFTVWAPPLQGSSVRNFKFQMRSECCRRFGGRAWQQGDLILWVVDLWFRIVMAWVWLWVCDFELWSAWVWVMDLCFWIVISVGLWVVGLWFWIMIGVALWVVGLWFWIVIDVGLGYGFVVSNCDWCGSRLLVCDFKLWSAWIWVVGLWFGIVIGVGGGDNGRVRSVLGWRSLVVSHGAHI